MKEKLQVKTNFIKPNYATKGSAGIDLYCANEEDIIIGPNETKKIDTGLSLAIPEGYFGTVYPRSSTGVKKKLMLANTIGVIDSDYRGEIMVFFYNYGVQPQTIKKGDRLAQIVIQPYQQFEIELVDQLDETDRGEGGFGSTGR